MNLIRCACYLALMGILGFITGRLLPKDRLDPDCALFRPLPFEDEGRWYEKLHIRRWQSKVPDMSRLLPSLMPPKNLTGSFKDRLPLMIRETCVAELIHLALAAAGLYCVKLWPGVGGRVVALLSLLGNLLFVAIQRYNRPRLMRLWHKLNGGRPLREEPQCAF